MGDVFVERIVKRKINLTGVLIRALCILAVLIAAFTILIFGVLGMTITVLVIYGAYLGWSYTSIEYEYAFLNGELSIDKIMGQRKRKFADSFDIKQAEIVGPADSEAIIRAAGNAKTVDYSTGYNSDEVYSMIVTKDESKVQVLFEPDEKMIDAMYHMRPNVVKKRA